ncbi:MULTISPECIES: hypothetical protein [Paenibacillus]|uniref:Uncharacterized protein n=1 Tax=Paenibacillus lautus TaxID=1401 RepID=A0A1R1B5P3_PAELA|nr:hypothetical protein [Paenibacillus lautus]OME94770.1 hypothetical protein BK123_06585 [Paenibacillus lautus]
MLVVAYSSVPPHSANSLGLTVNFQAAANHVDWGIILTEKVLEMVKVKGISGEGDTAHGEHLKAEAEDTF